MTDRLIKNIIAEELFGRKICESMDEQYVVNRIYSEVINEKIMMGEPVSVPELRDILRNKVLNFQFVKLNGEVRPAKGTTMQKYIPKEDHPKGIKPSSDKVATFYDLSKDAWRSVSNKSKEITVETDPETQKPIIKVSDKKPKEEPEKAKPVEKPEPAPEPMKAPEPAVPKPAPAAPVAPAVPKPAPAEPPAPPPVEKPAPAEPAKPLDIEDETKPAEEIEDKDIKAAGQTIKEPEETEEEPEEIEKPEEAGFAYRPIEDFEYRPIDKLPDSEEEE